MLIFPNFAKTSESASILQMRAQSRVMPVMVSAVVTQKRVIPVDSGFNGKGQIVLYLLSEHILTDTGWFQ